MIIEKFCKAVFLRDFWQKQPCIIKGFIDCFEDPIDEHDLAGLAQEPEVDARVISQHDGKWQVTQGPIENFEKVCRGQWTLLVQGVDRYINEVDVLSKAVDFVPDWRIDDVMVSFSVAGAGVGAHTDEYDVFIVQGKGQRRWQVGMPQASAECSPHPLLRQVDAFEACIDYVMSPGDALYIPPKHPHKGETLENCLNYSIGFRAPTQLEILHGMLDEEYMQKNPAQRYQDQYLQKRLEQGLHSAVVSKDELNTIKHMLIDTLTSASSEAAIMQFISRQALPDGVLPAEQYYLESDIIDLIQSNTPIHKAPGLKAIYTERSEALFCFYIDGNQYQVPDSLSERCRMMLNSEIYELSIQDVQDDGFIKLICTLLNQGYWQILEPECEY